jgi:prevent-host-death family protein
MVISMAKSITITEFKAHCLRLAAEVAATGEPLTVTRRGTPLVEIVPAKSPAELRGSVTQLVSDEELLAPTAPTWSAAAR